MKLQELLQTIVDIANRAERDSAAQAHTNATIDNAGERAEDLYAHEVGDCAAAAEVPNDDVVMVPPLQQKIELLKKATGVDNLYDREEDYKSETGSDQDDELSRIVRLSGAPKVSVVAVDEAASDSFE
jgi:hypothetical protein